MCPCDGNRKRELRESTVVGDSEIPAGDYIHPNQDVRVPFEFAFRNGDARDHDPIRERDVDEVLLGILLAVNACNTRHARRLEVARVNHGLSDHRVRRAGIPDRLKFDDWRLGFRAA